MSDRGAKAFLQDMLEATQRILSYVDGIDYASFQNDFKTQDAVFRNLEVLGEATKNIPAEVMEQYPDLPWRAMARTRDRLIHHYFGVNLDIVWGIAKLELPDVVEKLAALLKDFDS